jgi:hypothetical protein
MYTYVTLTCVKNCLCHLCKTDTKEAQRSDVFTPSIVKQHFIRCICFNARSAKNKLCDLRQLLYSDKYDVVMETESWLDESISDGILDPSKDYFIFRYDRTISCGEGVCVFILKRFSGVQIKLDNCYDLLEILCFDVFVRHAVEANSTIN